MTGAPVGEPVPEDTIPGSRVRATTKHGPLTVDEIAEMQPGMSRLMYRAQTDVAKPRSRSALQRSNASGAGSGARKTRSGLTPLTRMACPPCTSWAMPPATHCMVPRYAPATIETLSGGRSTRYSPAASGWSAPYGVSIST